MLTPGSVFQLTWLPESVLSPTLLQPENYTVDVTLYALDTTSEIWRETVLLQLSNQNDGEIEITLSTLPITGSIVPIAILVHVSLIPNSQSIIPPLQQGLITAESRAGKWTAQFYYAQPFILTSFMARFLCEAWFLAQTVNVEEVLNRTTPCPPTTEQAALPNSGVEVERYISFFGTTNYHTSWMSFFHPGASVCYRQRVFDSRSVCAGSQSMMCTLKCCIILSCRKGNHFTHAIRRRLQT